MEVKIGNQTRKRHIFLRVYGSQYNYWHLFSEGGCSIQSSDHVTKVKGGSFGLFAIRYVTIR